MAFNFYKIYNHLILLELNMTLDANLRLKLKLQQLRDNIKNKGNDISCDVGESLYLHSPKIMWKLADYLGQKGICDVLDVIDDTAKINSIVVHDLFWHSPELIRKISYDGFRSLAYFTNIIAGHS